MQRITDYKVNYGKLSADIRQAAIQGKGIDFTFNIDLLTNLVKDSELLVVYNNIKSKRIGPEDIVYLSEFFKREKLSWLDHFKFYSSLVFVRTDVPGALDDEFWQLMDDMKADQLENPDIDKAETLGKILRKYPCYVASVVSYKNADIKKCGTISYEIVCKANQVTIDIDNKKYHAPVNTTEESTENVEAPAEGQDTITD